MSVNKRVTAFVTPEISIDESLHTYSGGLGVIGGSMVYAAHRADYPLVAVSLLYREGYYDQGTKIGDSQMTTHYVARHYDDILEDTGVTVSIRIAEGIVRAKVWRLPPERFGTTTVLFLDPDMDGNDHLSRLNGLRLYPSLASTDFDQWRNNERRVAQWMILGYGAVEALKKLGYDVALYHLNEGHSGFVTFALVEQALSHGLGIDEAIKQTRSKVVFTTHTPVEAGNLKYPQTLVARMCNTLGAREIIERSTFESNFDVTASCLTLAKRANAVSRKHGHVAGRMWHWLGGRHSHHPAPITYVTNGSDVGFWQDERFRLATTAQALREAKQAAKRELFAYLRNETGKEWRDDVLTLVWARRFAGYKRPGLLFADYPWIANLLDSRKLQVICAGKPHPDDQQMIDRWNDLAQLSRRHVGLAVLSGYELELSKLLKRGADCWLNTPVAPLEACGTSGQSAAMNGTLNISTPDGWYLEADPDLHFRFGIDQRRTDQDTLDARGLRACLEERVLPLYYGEQHSWYEMALAAKHEAVTLWSSDRMLSDYIQRIYEPTEDYSQP